MSERARGGVTRRGLIGGAAAAGAAAALPRAAGAAGPATAAASVKKADVVVVGAGLAGLTTARELVRRGKSVVVLEARGRVGGRTLNAPLNGYKGKVVEIGGQWIGPTQDRLAALAKAMGVKTYKTYNEGKNVLIRNGQRSTYTGAVPLDIQGLPEIAKALLQINQMAATVPRDAPWKAPRAAEFDSQTFATFRDAMVVAPDAKFLLDLAINAVWAAESRDVSLLHVLFYTASAGNKTTPGDFNRLINVAGGAQESRFVGGSQRVSIEVAKRLGRRVVLNAPVRRIEQTKGGVRVVADGVTVAAKAVVVTLPPALTATIDYEPILPTLRAQLTQRMPQGSAIKCEAVYDEPFWRKEGYTGQVTTDGEPVGITFDNSPPGGKPGILLGFIEGAHARKWGSRRTASQRKAAVLDQFAKFYGERARRPKQYLEMNWGAEEYTRGCYVGFTPPGVLLDYGDQIRKPVGRIHWAGAETATIWNGYMDGAVSSGERAAKEVLGQL